MQPKQPLSSAASTTTNTPTAQPHLTSKADCWVRSFLPPTTATQTLLAWMRGHGQVGVIGVESTGSFGATLTSGTDPGWRAGGGGEPAEPAGPAFGRQVRPLGCRADRSCGRWSNFDRDPEGQARNGGGVRRRGRVGRIALRDRLTDGVAIGGKSQQPSEGRGSRQTIVGWCA